MVLFADYILEFRFEFLWPFWLLLRSVYDSFKYQGLVSITGTCNVKRIELNTVYKVLLHIVCLFQAFSIFFICIALTSDMICFFFIPVHWLFFAASTYVWVQYVWHTGTQKTNIREIDLDVNIPSMIFHYVKIRIKIRSRGVEKCFIKISRK